ncbi:hypothetical protein FBU30_001047 [Linnemannia zychae]|nr:hypothetical protein FBU30_001047 [Linnemannia zychae]
MATSATPTLIVLGSLFVYVALTGPTKLFVPMTNLIFHWTAYEDSLYSLTATFLAVFPALQWLYKKVVSDSQQMKSSQPLADSNESIINTSMETEFSNMDAIKMDLFFAASGMSLLRVL